MRILNGDNLQILKSLEGERFDLVELDGPYMAGLEGWDILTEAEYIQHYAERLTALRPLLQPWGVVFVFGYPEGCAEIKSWAHRTETLYLRRWLTWYKQITAHKGRKVEIVLLLEKNQKENLQYVFKTWFNQECKRIGKNEKIVKESVGIKGNFAVSGRLPSEPEYLKLKQAVNIPDEFDLILNWRSYEGATDIDFFSKTYSEQTENLNDEGLRSKPVGLYIDLFKPTIMPTKKRKALVLYGGSGNAAIAAEALGYEVTVIEQDPKRCKLIEKRSSRLVQTWREKLSQGNLWGFPTQPAPDAGESAAFQADFYTSAESTSQALSTPTQRR